MPDECDLLAIPSSWGAIELELARDGVVRCTLPCLNEIPHEPFEILDCGTDCYSLYVRSLFEGGNPERPPIGKLPGTEFQKTVWSGMLTVPHGKTISYADLAKKTGQASASRAVANACGKNPVPLFIPCHRIIRSDGNIGGFSSGLAWKRLLLGVEH